MAQSAVKTPQTTSLALSDAVTAHQTLEIGPGKPFTRVHSQNITQVFL
jgi:hypothetical protein